MGCCLPAGPEEENTEKKQTHKLLFLGPGGCGKSTFFKQLRHLQGSGFVLKDRIDAKQGIALFVVDTMKHLLKDEQLDRDLLSEEALQAANRIESLENRDSIQLSGEITNAIKVLWAEEHIKNTFETVAKLQLNGPCAYFFDDMDRISAVDFTPTDQDILYQRRPTSGIIEQIIDSRDPKIEFQLVDVGGQKNERRKWLHQFETISALIFVVSLAAFDEPLYEDETMNSLHDSLLLWEKTVNNRVFEGRLIYLIFNKIDVYKQKIAQTSLATCFAEHAVEYDEKELYDDCKTDDERAEKNLEFIQQLYLDKAKLNPVKELYVTCAYDESIVREVFQKIENSIMTQFAGGGTEDKSKTVHSHSKIDSHDNGHEANPDPKNDNNANNGAGNANNGAPDNANANDTAVYGTT